MYSVSDAIQRMKTYLPLESKGTSISGQFGTKSLSKSFMRQDTTAGSLI